MVSHSKFYFFDTGLYRTIRPVGPLDMPEEIEGQALETLFLQELIAVNAYSRLGYDIFYWRTSSNVEVDFVLYGPKGIKVFEIKRSGKVSGGMLSGLKAFRKDYAGAKPYLVYGGDRRLRDGDIEIIPAAEAFANLSEILSD